MREAILSAAELLFPTRGFNAVSIRDIALEAGANPGSITYHFKTKDGLLLEIYKRHCGPMNKRRIELLVAARRVRDVQDRLEAIVRAYIQNASHLGLRDDILGLLVQPWTTSEGQQAFYRQIDLPQEQAYAEMREIMATNAVTCDAQEGMQAFLDKRPPVWEGR